MLNPHWEGHVLFREERSFHALQEATRVERSVGKVLVLPPAWGGFPLLYCSYIEVCSTCVHPQLAYLQMTLFPLLWFCSCRALVD